MPIYEDTMSQADMKRCSEDGHICAECGGLLSVAWIQGRWCLRCGNNIAHNKITMHDKEWERKMNMVKLDSIAISRMTKDQMLMRIGNARFPQELNAQERKVLAQVAIDYGFDPLMGEITLYQGRPYVSIDGRYRKAQETDKLESVSTRPANEQERADWQIPEGDYFFRAEVKVKNAGVFVGWGRVHGNETKGSPHLPVVKDPQRMAEKRAESQALRKAFHIPLPSIEDIGGPEDENVIEGEVKIVDQPAAENKPQEVPAIIRLDWLKESLDTLKSKNISGWSNASVIRTLNEITGGQAATTVSGAVALLKEEHRPQAEAFTKKLQLVLDMA